MRHPRDCLPRSANVFFGQFENLTPVQEHAIPAIALGHDVLLCSPTASGKTEAFAAPAAEFVLAAPRRDRLSALIVSPTRALANDLKRRLEGRFDTLGLRFGRYTGEHKDLVAGKMPEICVTTPEALDSLLARHPERLLHLRLVVLDEIHVLDGSPRGDQLRVLLHRLGLVTKRRAQRIAASATIDRPLELAARYLDDARIVESSGARRIVGMAFFGRGGSEMQAHLGRLAAEGFRKILAFCNRRQDVELFAATLRDRTPFQDLVFAHHGSLSQLERERTERRFLEAKAAICFATMTLEMGIDIGSVDYVLLVSPPPDVASLLQRLGRGGRRTDESRVGYVVESSAEAHRLRAMLEAGAPGELLAHPYGLRPGVFAQQAMVIAGRDGHVAAAVLEREIPLALWREAPALDARALLDSMAELGHFEKPRGGNYVLGEADDDQWRRGSLHSNIADQSGPEIIDRLTGDVLGHLDTEEGQHRVNVAGRGRVIVKETSDRILTDRLDHAAVPRFKPRGAPITSFALARRLVEKLGVPADSIAQWRHGNTTIVLHGLGSVGRLLFTRILKTGSGAGEIERASPCAHVIAAPLELLPKISDEWLSSFLHDNESRLAKALAMGPHHGVLPETARIDALRGPSGLDQLAEFLRGATLLEPVAVDPELAETAAQL